MDTAPLHVRTEREALSYLGVGDLSSDHPDTFGMGLGPGTEALARHYDLGSAQDVMNVYGLCQISGREKREAVGPPGLLAYAAAISAGSARQRVVKSRRCSARGIESPRPRRQRKYCRNSSNAEQKRAADAKLPKPRIG